jgi:hypothetical protein
MLPLLSTLAVPPRPPDVAAMPLAPKMPSALMSPLLVTVDVRAFAIAGGIDAGRDLGAEVVGVVVGTLL